VPSLLATIKMTGLELRAGPHQEGFDYRGMELFWVQLVFLVIAEIFVLLRAYVKVFLVKSVTADDWFMFVPAVSTIFYPF
jgi:hypothetical protein